MSESTELAVHETHDVFESYDLADEEQILSEMAGRVTDKYVYTFKQGGQEVTGLSFAGTNWAVREYAKQGEIIRLVGRPEIVVDPTDPDFIVVIITAQRFVLNRDTGKEIALDSTIGVKRQGKFMDKKKFSPEGEMIGYEKIVDPFYVEKAVSKAVRNAKQALIPTDIVKKMIARAIDSRNGKNVQGKNQQQRPQNQGQPQRQAPPAPQPTQSAPPPPPPQPPQQQASAAPIRGSVPAQQNSAPAQSSAAPSQVAVQQPPPPPPPPAPAPAPAAPVQQAPPPAPQPSPGTPEMPKDVMVQKLDAVLKAVFGTQDTAIARQGLQRLTGFGSPADMPVDKIKALGNTLNMVVKKAAVIEVNRIVRLQDKVVLWQGPEVPQAAASGDQDAMF